MYDMNNTDPISHLIWLDLEMSGLDINHNRILEIATIITDKHLNIIAQGPVFAICQPLSLIEKMNTWNTKTHRESGLVDRVLNSTVDEKAAEHQTLNFIKKHVDCQTSPLCGNSVHQDRLFLKKFMPALETYFHYRNLDVTTLKILTQLWNPDLSSKLNKTSTHTALQDIKDSINELKFYRKTILNT
jgi:oligoribonuclease